MNRPRSDRPDRHADAVAIGRPDLAVADEERAALEDLVAELLIAALERSDEEDR